MISVSLIAFAASLLVGQVAAHGGVTSYIIDGGLYEPLTAECLSHP